MCHSQAAAAQDALTHLTWSQGADDPDIVQLTNELQKTSIKVHRQNALACAASKHARVLRQLADHCISMACTDHTAPLRRLTASLEAFIDAASSVAHQDSDVSNNMPSVAKGRLQRCQELVNFHEDLLSNSHALARAQADCRDHMRSEAGLHCQVKKQLEARAAAEDSASKVRTRHLHT